MLLHNILGWVLLPQKTQNYQSLYLLLMIILIFPKNPAVAQQSCLSLMRGTLTHSLRVKIAEDEVERAKSTVSEMKDVYIPSFSIGGGLGKNYGITLFLPTIFTVTAQSMVYSPSQRSYIQSARDMLTAAQFSLNEAITQSKGDLALTCLSLEEARERIKLLTEVHRLSTRMNEVTRIRVNAGIGSQEDVVRTQRSVLQADLDRLQSDNTLSEMQGHLRAITEMEESELSKLSGNSLLFDRSLQDEASTVGGERESEALRALVLNARAKEEQAHGDRRLSRLPLVSLESQYGRISPINNVSDYYNLRGQYNVAQFGVIVSVPLFDRTRAAKLHEAAAIARRAGHEAELATEQYRESQTRSQNELTQLMQRSKLVELDQRLTAAHLRELKEEEAVASSSVTGEHQTNPIDVLSAELEVLHRELETLGIRAEVARKSITRLMQVGGLDEWLESHGYGSNKKHSN